MRILIAILLLTIMGCGQPLRHENTNSVVTTDIANFWNAFDQVNSTVDTAIQREYLQELFFDKASPGQQAMFAARRYTVDEYLGAIRDYPRFWESVRPATLTASDYAADLSEGIEQLRKIYPELRPAKIYFTIGALRSNGTTMDSMVLIGTELALTNAQTPSDELSERLSHLGDFFKTEPGKHLVFLNVHEYIHTQQSTTMGYNLLAQTVLEGAAEFVAELAMGTDSPNPQIAFGRENDARIKAAFQSEMYSPNFRNWLWNSPDNEFGMRDLAYYVGFRICENYYDKAEDKSQAIREIIELDYNDEAALTSFVDKSGYFDQAVSSFKAPFESSRPTVEKLVGIEQGAKDIDPATKRIRVKFSEKMDTRRISTDLGPMGRDHFPDVSSAAFSEDSLYLTYELNLEPAKTYQMVLHWNMRNRAGVPLVPYTIEFTTKGL